MALLDEALVGSPSLCRRRSEEAQEGREREEGRCVRKPDMCAVAAPFPLLGSELRSHDHGVQVDVAGCGGEVLLGQGWTGREGVAEKVTRTAVHPITAARKTGRKRLHSP